MKELKSESTNEVNRPPWRGLLIFFLIAIALVSLGKELLYRPEPLAPPLPTAWPTQTALPTYTPHPTYTPVILTATPNHLATQQALELATVAADSGQQMALQMTRLAIIQATVEPMAKELDQTAAAVVVLDHEVNTLKDKAGVFLTAMGATAVTALLVSVVYMVNTFYRAWGRLILDPEENRRTVSERFFEPEVEPLRTVLGTVPVRALEPVLEPQELEKLDPSRPPTAREVRLIQSTYNRFKSKTAVCNALYGFKNQAVWDYVSNAIDSSGGGE